VGEGRWGVGAGKRPPWNPRWLDAPPGWREGPVGLGATPWTPRWPCGPALPRRRRAGAEGGAVPGDDHAGGGEDPLAAAPQRRSRGGQRVLGRAVRPPPGVGARVDVRGRGGQRGDGLRRVAGGGR